MAFVRAGDLTVHYELSGPAESPAVMFVNPLGANFHVWDPQAAALAGQFRILRYDLRGHGLTDCPPAEPTGAYTIARLADDAAALLDRLGIARVHVCGLSIGGMVAQRLAATEPGRVASLVLCNTANRIATASVWDERIALVRRLGAEGIAPVLLGRSFTPEFAGRCPDIVRGFGNMLMRTPAEGYIGSCCAIRDADLRAEDALISCPTLVVVGDQDVATPLQTAQALCSSIRGARLEILPGAGHIATLEQPVLLSKVLESFFSAAAAV